MRWSASQGGTLGQIHLVDLGSGDVVARLAPITVDKRIGSTGAWRGDTVVMTSDRARLVELRVTDQSIELLRTIELLPDHDIEEGPGDVAYTNGGIVAVLGQTSFEGPQAPLSTTTIVSCDTGGSCEPIGIRTQSVDIIGRHNTVSRRRTHARPRLSDLPRRSGDVGPGTIIRRAMPA